MLLERTGDIVRRAFFDPVAPDNADAMIRVAHDDQHPIFLRAPILEILRKGMVELMLVLTLSRVNDKGEMSTAWPTSPLS